MKTAVIRARIPEDLKQDFEAVAEAQEMIDEKTGEVDTQHSSFPVPFIIADHRQGAVEKKYELRTGGVLGSVAPTVLELMGKRVPKEMTEKSLIV